jgi:excisionase family DNA binding protein
MQNEKRELLTRRDLCELFQVSLSTVIRWERSGKLPVVRLGAGLPRYRRSEVDNLIASASVKVQ